MRRGLHTCMLCEAACGLEVELQPDGRVLSVRGDRLDPLSAGHICPKATAIADTAADPDRILAPQRRVGDRWQTVGWDEALDEAATRLTEIQRHHGRNAVALYLGNPTVHSYAAALAAPYFARAIGTRNRFSATSVDQLPMMLACQQMFGHSVLFPIPDVDRTHFMLVLGANPLASNGSLMTAPGMASRLKALRARGGRLVVIDPRRTETAAVADEHLFIRPGTDAYLLLAILDVLFSSGRANPGRLAAFTDGLDVLQAAARRFAPARVAERTGIPAARIHALAIAFAEAPAAVAYGRVGISTQEFGGLASWLTIALNIVTGNLDRPGGSMFTTPAADLVRLLAPKGDLRHFRRWKSRVRGLPEFAGELPVAALAEEIETPGDGQIRSLITYAGNPVLSTPDGRRLERALPNLEFMVAIDLYRNETTRHANLILPTSFGFERDHYDLVFYALAVRNVARYVPPLVAAPAGVRPDGEVLLDLSLRLLRAGGGRQDARLRWTLRALRALGPRRTLDLLLRFGPHGVRRVGQGISLRALARQPHGIDLGAMQPRLPDRLFTPGRRVRAAPEHFVADLARLEARLAEGGGPSNGTLVMVGRRLLRSNNSWMHNARRLVKGRDACTLMMHPEDARSRGLADGARVRIRSRVGEVEVPLQVTEEIARGVVSLPHGYGHARDGVALAVAREHAGASLNDLTDAERVDELSGNAAFSGVEVSVEAASAERAATA
jgi:anaerobic selenocysteine-containing dehydrogenase